MGALGPLISRTLCGVLQVFLASCSYRLLSPLICLLTSPFKNFSACHRSIEIVSKRFVIKVCSGQVHTYMSSGVFVYPRDGAITDRTQKRSAQELTSGCTQCRMRCLFLPKVFNFMYCRVMHAGVSKGKLSDQKTEFVC